MGIYKDILEKLNTGQKVVILTTLGNTEQSGKSQPKKAYYTEDELKKTGSIKSVNVETRQLIQQALASGELQLVNTSDKKLLIAEPFFPEPSLIIFGGGHIGKALCEFGAKLGFSITVVDDRIEFANVERFPDADAVICESFEKSFENLQFNPYTCVVIVTRGHRHDLICLREIAKKPWAYAGMIGARRRVDGVKEQLISEGTPREILEKVNSPIGLDIGAVTPGELAISILAQVISYRRLENPKMGRESARIMWTEFDRDVIEALSLGRNAKRVIATVISTRGSAPRRAGTKMLVWADGRILGSVGGGLAESKVIQSAQHIIRNGGYLIQTFDLNGCIADEGMVCGGDMSVLIESVRSR